MQELQVGGTNAVHRDRTLPVSVSSVPLFGASGSSVPPRVVPSASLKPGPVGFAAAPAAQTWACVFMVRAWFAFICAVASGGMPHDCALSVTNLTTFASAAE